VGLSVSWGYQKMTYTLTGTLEKKSVTWVGAQVKKENASEKSYKYYPFGMQTANSWTRENTTGNNYLYNAGAELNQTANIYETFFRGYDPALGRMMQIDPKASKYSSLTPYNYAFNDPVYWNDPFGADPINSWDDFWRVVQTLWDNTPMDPGGGGSGSGMGSWSASGGYNYFGSGSDGQWYQVGGGGSSYSGGAGDPGSANSYVSTVYSGWANSVSNANTWSTTQFSSFQSFSNHTMQTLGIGLLREVNVLETYLNKDWLQARIDHAMFGDVFKEFDLGKAFKAIEDHYNGGLDNVNLAVYGFNNMSNETKRAFAYKLSKHIDVKSGRIFQSAKSFTKSTSKLTSKLGPIGTALSIGVIGYELTTDTWNAHTIIDGALLIGAGAAVVFGAPAVLIGIGVYGVLDYAFDISGKVDKAIGRESGVWDGN
jgi:RHS repeat-associated protein